MRPAFSASRVSVHPEPAPGPVPGACASRCDRAGSCSCNDGGSQLLDVLYALAGTGVVRTADGHERRISSGDSLVAWHNTTHLRSLPGEEPPVLLKFHFPAAVLMLPPGTVVAPAPSHADLKVLVDECQGPQDGELSAQEADDLLRGVQTRAARAISHLYASQSDSEEQPQQGHQAAAAASAAAAAAVPASASAGRPALNNAVPVPPLLRRLLRSATGAWLPGLGKMRPQQSASAAPQRQQAPPPVHATMATSSSAAAPPAEAAAAAVASSSGCVLLQRALEDFKAFRFPRQTNKLAFVFDPAELGLSLSFGVEVFEPGHHTPLHIHKTAHELFFVLAGEGVAFCNGQRFTVRAGDVVVFPPRAVHGIDNKTDSKLYCLQLMTPNEAFVEHVKSGEAVGRLDDEDICSLASRHC
ncbi:hypothetical protein HYH02_000119 [Chlamydomonas schloesseri]|uniref:Cupin type-1 domain-containing protein n=1 Tax=Chlamydomonas schloesseri TaxID=2026947 RepID=A0A835WNR5_9CHLO|nr:hypothetical protein HYH02_000119 [Chlamydomonas schloesseri]|eukprot:KAG2450015.1 hypothetical protein HYH02_000119 [Chlamydomonas schloesseri]